MIAEDACLKCSLCVSQCPVVREDMEFPGPKALGPEWFRRQQSGDAAAVMDAVDDCTFCQLCEDACPVGVPVAHLIAEHKSRKSRAAITRFRDFMLTHPHWVARAPQMANVPGRLSRLIGFASKTQKPTIRRWKGKPAWSALDSDQGHVTLFVDCYSRGYDREIVGMASALLELWGYRVTTAPNVSRCCGAAAYAGGYPQAAQSIAADTAHALKDVSGIMVTLNATCDATIRHEWPKYLGLSAPSDLTAFEDFALAHAPKAFWTALRTQPQGDESWIFSHTTCRSKVARGEGTLRELGERAGWIQDDVNMLCCGAAGSYAFKQEHAETAHRMGRHVMEATTGRWGGIMVDSGTCALHLEQLSGLPARHPAYWLYHAYAQSLQKGSVHVG